MISHLNVFLDVYLNPLFLKNWRPITLLNTDYKLVAKAIAERLKNVIPLLIHSDQTGFIKGRFIGENINKILNIIEHCEKNNLLTIIVNIDFEKAFDSLEWSQINRTLEFFNFGSDLIKWTKLLYKGCSSKIQNNGCVTQ